MNRAWDCFSDVFSSPVVMGRSGDFIAARLWYGGSDRSDQHSRPDVKTGREDRT